MPSDACCGAVPAERGLGAVDEFDARSAPCIDDAASERVADYDFQYKRHETTGQDVPFRVEYVVERTRAGKALLGHPFVLRSVEKLQGADFVPTWDSMVFKLPGAATAIEWHRDADTRKCDPDRPIFNVDFYLDGSDESNCLWGIPGSNRWTDEEASRARALLRVLADGARLQTYRVPHHERWRWE